MTTDIFKLMNLLDLPDEVLIRIVSYISDHKKRLVVSKRLSEDISLKRELRVDDLTCQASGDIIHLSKEKLHGFLSRIHIGGIYSKTNFITDNSLLYLLTVCGHNITYLNLSNGTNTLLTNESLFNISKYCVKLVELCLSGFLTSFKSKTGPGQLVPFYDNEGIISLHNCNNLRKLDVSWSCKRKSTKELSISLEGCILLALKSKFLEIIDARMCSGTEINYKNLL